ncbi:MAG: LysR family transcriptional regulator [Myxococcota bacterium]
MLNEIDLASVDLNLLVLFEAVFETRHVASAAKRLHVSPSAVSHGLGRLRDLFEDPLFVRNPKGVLPSDRAQQLAPRILEILGRVRGVLGASERFDPSTSTRRFKLGAPDAVLAVLLPPLLTILSREAPRIDLATRHLLPTSAFREIDAGDIDILLGPLDDIPVRFHSRVLFEEEFVIAARARHPFLRAPSLKKYCELEHVLVSLSGDHHGYVDEVLARQGNSRRVALAVPNFMLALAALTDTNLVAAVPSSLVRAQGARFNVKAVRAPVALRSWQLRAVAPKAALADPGVAWLFDAVLRASKQSRHTNSSSKVPARKNAKA